MIPKSGRKPELVVTESEKLGAPNRAERSATLEFGGTVVGTLSGVARNGEALIDLPGNATLRRIPARSCIPLASSDVGKEAVLVFEGGDLTLPIVIGLVQRHESQMDALTRLEVPSVVAATQSIDLDEKRVELTARETITLRCGDASITLNR